MIVAYSRPIAMKIYKRILELRPAWKNKVAVVMTGSNKDPEEWHDIIGNKAHKDELALQFKEDFKRRRAPILCSGNEVVLCPSVQFVKDILGLLFHRGHLDFHYVTRVAPHDALLGLHKFGRPLLVQAHHQVCHQEYE
jgi:hypothetical protein